MKTVIIDDQAATRSKLKKLLAVHAPQLELIGEAESVATGNILLQQVEPELLLLDVEMGDGTGFDLLAQLSEINFKVVFITAHDGFAIRAFKYSAIDYILKPVDPEDLKRAIERAQANQTPKSSSKNIEVLLSNQQQAEQKLLLNDADNVYLVNQNDVVRLESESNYTRFYLTNGQVVLIARTLKEFAEVLVAPLFFRPHRSHLINLNHFGRLDKKNGGTIYMRDGSSLPVATRKKEQLIEALRSL